MSLIRGGLFSRLVLIAAAAIGPVVLVVAYVQMNARDEQEAARNVAAQRQAEMISNELATILNDAGAMAVAISQYASVRQFDPACSAKLIPLAMPAGRYATLRVADQDGAVVCAAPAGASAGINAPTPQTILQPDGLYLARPATGGPPLLVGLPFTGENHRHGTIELAFSRPWLTRHFGAIGDPGDRLTVSDRNGAILLQIPPAGDVAAARLPAPLLEKLAATQPGSFRATDPSNGAGRLVGYVPASRLPMGLFVALSHDALGQAGALASTQRRADLLMVLGAGLSLALAIILGDRFLRRPARAVVAAAAELSRNDGQSRMAVDPRDRSEFGQIAQAFNAMAVALAHQRDESHELQATLEARVAERTGELQRSRDQLQVALGEQAKSEASLAQAQKLQAVGQLAGGIAHDFNNLLTAVIGALELLRIRLPGDDARSLRLVDNALHAADRGGRLTSQLLTFSRRQRLLPVATDLNTVVLGMLSLLTTTLGRDIRVETGLARLLWPALVDPHQVESAILNLALNARDAMPSGGTLRISTSNVTLPHALARPVEPGQADGAVTPVSPQAGEYVMIRVSDTGIGMPPAVLARVFEPFFTTKQTGRGSGLGLSQVHGLAAQSGGELRAESQPGLGTSISLLLPRAMMAAARVAGVPDMLEAGQARLRVLVVDDDADVRRLTGEMLSELGHHPILVEDGGAALAALAVQASSPPAGHEEARIDLLLADYAMPGQNGMEVIAQACDAWPDLTAILVTGHADIDGPILVGGQKVLRKPFTMAALANALEGMTVAG